MPTGSTMHAGRQALTTGRQDLSRTSAIAKELPPYRLDTVNRHSIALPSVLVCRRSVETGDNLPEAIPIEAIIG